MAKKTVDEDVILKANQELTRAEGQRKAMVAYYKGEKTETVRIPPMYKPYFGSVMQLMINGISIAVPVNGTMVTVPATFADEIAERMMKIDAIVEKQTRMSDVNNNVDQGSPGSLQMF